jgi:hypothetical protein
VFQRFGVVTLYVGASCLALAGAAAAWVALSSPEMSRPAPDVDPEQEMDLGPDMGPVPDVGTVP